MVTTYFYLRALQEPVNGRPFSTELEELGTVHLYVYRDPRAKNKVAYMRKPRILVEDKTNNTLSGYCAVFVCESDAGNAFLSMMEDPAHQQWHESQAKNWTEEKRQLARNVRLKGIRNWIDATLKELAAQSQTADQDVEGLADFLPDDEDNAFEGGSGHGPPGKEGQAHPETGRETPQETPPSEIPISATPATNRRGRSDDGAEDEPGDLDAGGGGQGDGDRGSSGAGGGPNPGADGTGPGPGGGAGGDGSSRSSSSSRISGRDIAFRSFLLGPGHYRVVLRAKRACSGPLRIRALGDDATYPIRLLEAETAGALLKLSEDHSAVDNLRLEADGEMVLDLKILSEIPLSLGVGDQ